MPKRLLISRYNKTTQFPQKGLKMVSFQAKNCVFLLIANFLKLYHHLYFHYLPKRQLIRIIYTRFLYFCYYSLEWLFPAFSDQFSWHTIVCPNPPKREDQLMSWGSGITSPSLNIFTTSLPSSLISLRTANGLIQ